MNSGIIDKEQVREMASWFTQAEIAERLDITERHVRRILSGFERYRPRGNSIDLETERDLAFIYHTMYGESYRQVGWRFGRSHEWVRKVIAWEKHKNYSKHNKNDN